jgi:hypothetical protein
MMTGLDTRYSHDLMGHETRGSESPKVRSL